MPPTIESTNGAWLTGLFLESILQGMGLLQVFLYFAWYHKDPWSIKGTVILLTILECVQLGGAYANVYQWFVTGFGDRANLNVIHNADMIQVAALFLSTFVAQVHFGRSIYQLHREALFFPIAVFFTALVSLAGGVGQIVILLGIRHYSDISDTNSPYTSNIQAGASLLCDILITTALCWRLQQGKSGVQSTNKVLNFLIMTAINRSVVTMIFAVVNIILFLSQPGTMYFMLAALLGDKLYMNSLLAMLNTRRYAGELRGVAPHVHSAAGQPPRAIESFHAPPPAPPMITVQKETRRDGDSDEFTLVPSNYPMQYNKEYASRV